MGDKALTDGLAVTDIQEQDLYAILSDGNVLVYRVYL